MYRHHRLRVYPFPVHQNVMETEIIPLSAPILQPQRPQPRLMTTNRQALHWWFLTSRPTADTNRKTCSLLLIGYKLFATRRAVDMLGVNSDEFSSRDRRSAEPTDRTQGRAHGTRING